VNDGHGSLGRWWLAAISASVVALWCAPLALASPAGANARPASQSERHAITAAYAREDGSPSEIRGVFVSRANASLAIACAKTPEAGTFAYVFTRSGRRWRYATSGRPGRAGTSADRKLERACG
jgi:hypothetical protein